MHVSPDSIFPDMDSLFMDTCCGFNVRNDARCLIGVRRPPMFGGHLRVTDHISFIHDYDTRFNHPSWREVEEEGELPETGAAFVLS